jgi:hypothetical protein
MLFNRKSHSPELKKHAVVYISDKYKHLIIAPMSQNDAGIIYEQDTCTALAYSEEATELGELTLDNFNRYSVKDVNLRDHKSTDWPAFKHSKSKSVRAFEQDYIRISVEGANEKNIILLFSGLPYKNCKLTVNASISYHADKEEIGQRILSVYDACLTGRIF